MFSLIISSYKKSNPLGSAASEACVRIKIIRFNGRADIIFGMERKHLNRIKEKYSHVIACKTLINLYIKKTNVKRRSHLYNVIVLFLLITSQISQQNPLLSIFLMEV
jgi:hypothetical protein